MARWEFETKLVRPEGVGTWTFAPIPVEIAKETGIRARLRVKGTIDGLFFRGTLLPRGEGSHFIVVNKELRDRIEKCEGDVVSVKMDLDDQPPIIQIPEDFATALKRNAKAKAHFEGIAPSHKKAYLQWIGSAKQPETRKRRIAKAVTMLSRGELR